MNPRKVRLLRHDLAHRRREAVGSIIIRRTIVLGDQTADRYARIFIEQWQHRLPDRAADILEINVDAVWAGGRQLGGKIGGTEIDRRVEAQFVSDEGAFLRTAGNADRPGVAEL